MTKEVERVEKAIDAALTGKSYALVSGGNPGIYAMAGLVFEICKQREIILARSRDHKRTKGKDSERATSANSTKTLVLEIIPGIPALAAGAALAGAPLTHDFAAISLSDLLTPWDKIEKRLSCAAMADFVIFLYNAKSKKRYWQLKKDQELILEHRGESTPVAIITGAMRENQNISFIILGQMDTAGVHMQTVVFIGSSTSLRYLDFLFTQRGYGKKYNI